jgi:uncharacterized protein YgbK (DUF1537 family)
MIAVIADDISGAAELAGAALRHGLRAEVQTGFDPGTDADVICVDTDTRSMTAPEAAQAAGEAARRVAAVRPEWIYKKCDSVLRGHVLAELRAIMAATGRPRAVLVSANPSRGRVIRGGRLWVKGEPLSATAFARDPEHPRRTSDVAELLGGDLSGVMVPDADSEADLGRHAALVDDGTLAGGGVDFFETLLTARGWAPSACGTGPAADERRSAGPGGKDLLPVTLMVCGSAASWSLRRQQAAQRGVPLFNLPLDAGEIVGALRSNRCALIGIGEGPATAGAAPSLLVRKLAEASAGVLREATVTRMLLEGGATAAAVVRELGWMRLLACEASAPGIGTLQPLEADAPILSIKPGSYDWPAGFWP